MFQYGQLKGNPMSETRYLKMRGKRFYLRIAISRKLHPYTSRREVERAIKTDSYRLAVRVINLVHDNYKRFEMELVYFATSSNLPLEHIKQKVGEAFSVKLADIDRIIAQEVLSGSQGQLQGNLSSPLSNLFTTPITTHKDEANEVEQQVLLSDAIQEYLKDKAVTVTDKTIKRYKLICEVLLELVGDKPITQVTRTDLRGLKQSLPNIPTNREKQSQYDGMTLKEIVSLPHNDSTKYYSENTQRSRLIDLASLFTWLKREGYILNNPAEGISTGYTRMCAQARRPFSQDELDKLFQPDVYLDAVGNSMAHFWIPLIALHTGARLEEISQLHVDDIREENGVWLICLDTQSANKNDKKKLKNISSSRTIPVHPALIKLGLIAYKKLMMQEGAVRLFPKLSNENANNAYGDVIGKWFRRYRLKDNKAPSRSTPFHSLRNTVSDALKKAGVDQVMIKEILGHSHTDVTNRHYAQEYGVAQKLEAVSILDFKLEFVTKVK